MRAALVDELSAQDAILRQRGVALCRRPERARIAVSAASTVRTPPPCPGFTLDLRRLDALRPGAEPAGDTP